MEKTLNKGKMWKFKNSLYIIFAFFSLAGISFLYIGNKTHNKEWKKRGFLYLIAIIIPGVNIIAYFRGIVSIVKTKKEYLIRLSIESSLVVDAELLDILSVLKARKEYLIRVEIESYLGVDVDEDREVRDKIYQDYGFIDSETKKSAQKQKVTEKPVETLSENEYVRKLQGFSWKILKSETRKQLEEIELICSKIFEYVEKHPESEYKHKPLINYYLPELFTQMDKYIELQKNVNLNIPNINTSMNKIESLLPMIKDASNKIYNQLFTDSLLDISTDIEVLKKQLTQNGLADSDTISMYS